jgi:hypothetical protein
MRIKLRTRIERLENRLIPESDGLLPLSVLRHCMDGYLSPSEHKRWGPLIARTVADAKERIARNIAENLVFGYTSESPRSRE